MAKRVLLANNTGNECHHGCDIVTRNIYELCNRESMHITRTLYSESLNADFESLFSKSDFDAVIINGEGTIHDSQPRAMHLSDLIDAAVNRNIAVHVVNSTISGNDDKILSSLSKAKHVFVRESFSRDYLHAQGIKSKIVPDLSFYAQYKNREGMERENIGVTDSVSPNISRELFRYACERSYDFLPALRDPSIEMDSVKNVLRKAKFKGQSYYSSIAGALNLPVSYAVGRFRFYDKNYEEYIERIASLRLLIAAKFHSMCFAIKTQTPFFLIGSNTHKMEALICDIGLSSMRIKNLSEILDAGAADEVPFSEIELRSINGYSCGARARIEEMFSEISQC